MVPKDNSTIETYKLLIDSSPDIIFIFQDNKVLFANETLKKLFNFSSGESEGKINIFKFIPPEYRELVKKNIALRLKGENIPSYELKLLLPENNEIFVRVHNNLITFNGKPAIMGVLQDITELKKLEEKITFLSKQTEEFSKITSEILSVEDEQELLDKISSAIVEISDFKRVLISYFKNEKPYRDIIGSKGVSQEVLDSIINIEMPREKYLKYFKNAINLGNQSCYIPHYMKNILDQRAVDYGKEEYPNGNQYWHKEDNLLIAIKDKKGDFVGIISVDDSKSCLKPSDETVKPLEIFADQISEIIVKKKLESQLEKLSEFHKKILENTAVGINTLDLKLNITSWNRASQIMTGFSFEDVRDKSVLESISEDNVEKFQLFINKLFITEKNEEQFLVKCKNGKLLPVYMISSLIRDENNKPYGIVQVLQDISAQERLKSQLQQSEKLAAIGELVSGVAHELNNPLATISGFSEFIKNKVADEKLTKMASTIFKETHRCARIIENLMSFARQKEIKERSIKLHEILDRALELREYHLKIGNIVVLKNFSKDIQDTLGDQNQLLQVFLNIINNAFDAMHDYQKKGVLTINTFREHNYNIIEFIDTGPGIDKNIKDKIFLPFFTTKEIGKGTGLGLSTSYGIIKNHKGEFTIDDTYENGAKFIIKLPVKMSLLKETSEVSDITQNGYKYSGNIVVIDDESNILEMSKAILENKGFTVDVFSNGKDGLEMIRKNNYDAIIVDIRMPGEIDGKNLYKKIKEEKPGIENKIVFITGDIISEDTRDFLKNIRNSYVLKPFDIEELENAVIEALTS